MVKKKQKEAVEFNSLGDDQQEALLNGEKVGVSIEVLDPAVPVGKRPGRPTAPWNRPPKSDE